MFQSQNGTARSHFGNLYRIAKDDWLGSLTRFQCSVGRWAGSATSGIMFPDDSTAYAKVKAFEDLVDGRTQPSTYGNEAADTSIWRAEGLANLLYAVPWQDFDAPEFDTLKLSYDITNGEIIAADAKGRFDDYDNHLSAIKNGREVICVDYSYEEDLLTDDNLSALPVTVITAFADNIYETGPDYCGLTEGSIRMTRPSYWHQNNSHCAQGHSYFYEDCDTTPSPLNSNYADELMTYGLNNKLDDGHYEATDGPMRCGYEPHAYFFTDVEEFTHKNMLCDPWSPNGDTIFDYSDPPTNGYLTVFKTVPETNYGPDPIDVCVTFTEYNSAFANVQNHASAIISNASKSFISAKLISVVHQYVGLYRRDEKRFHAMERLSFGKCRHIPDIN